MLLAPAIAGLPYNSDLPDRTRTRRGLSHQSLSLPHLRADAADCHRMAVTYNNKRSNMGIDGIMLIMKL